MTNASFVLPLTEQGQPQLPERDTVEHAVLHTLIGAADRRGVCRLTPSEITTRGAHSSQSEVWNILCDLADAGVIEPDEGGYRLLAKCPSDCAPARNNCKKVARDLSIESILKKKAQLLDKPVQGLGASPGGCDEAAEVPEELNAELGDSLPLLNGGVYVLVGPRRVKCRGHSLDLDHPQALAFYFEAKIKAAHPSFGAAVDPINNDGLRKRFSGWLRGGVTGDEIRDAIDYFTARPYTGKTPPWKQFLADRQHLIEQARRIAKDREMEAHRLDPEYWMPKPEVRDLEEVKKSYFAGMSERDRELLARHGGIPA